VRSAFASTRYLHQKAFVFGSVGLYFPPICLFAVSITQHRCRLSFRRHISIIPKSTSTLSLSPPLVSVTALDNFSVTLIAQSNQSRILRGRAEMKSILIVLNNLSGVRIGCRLPGFPPINISQFKHHLI